MRSMSLNTLSVPAVEEGFGSASSMGSTPPMFSARSTSRSPVSVSVATARGSTTTESASRSPQPRRAKHRRTKQAGKVEGETSRSRSRSRSRSPLPVFSSSLRLTGLNRSHSPLSPLMAGAGPSRGRSLSERVGSSQPAGRARSGSTPTPTVGGGAGRSGSVSGSSTADSGLCFSPSESSAFSSAFSSAKDELATIGSDAVSSAATEEWADALSGTEEPASSDWGGSAATDSRSAASTVCERGGSRGDPVTNAWSRHEARRSAVRAAREADAAAAALERARKPQAKPKASSLKLNALRKKLRLQSLKGPGKRAGGNRRQNLSVDMRMGDDELELFDTLAPLAPLSTSGPSFTASSGAGGEVVRRLTPTGGSVGGGSGQGASQASVAGRAATATTGGTMSSTKSKAPTPLTSLFEVAQAAQAVSGGSGGSAELSPGRAGLTSSTSSERLRMRAPAPLVVPGGSESADGSVVALSSGMGSGGLQRLEEKLAAQDEVLRQLAAAVTQLTEETSASRSSLRKRFAAVSSRIERSEKLTQKLSRDLQMQIDHSESVVYSYSNKLRRVEQALMGRASKNSTIADALISWLISVVFILLWVVRLVYRVLTCSWCRGKGGPRWDLYDSHEAVGGDDDGVGGGGESDDGGGGVGGGGYSAELEEVELM
ncbi:uncharacterized protein AMSG_07688 [Thecamonas trahens ATCC 50062]|uniref:Uncharacterized protein n=1 Tax=Thecamonas trahens ATCC 50062 TaxID=461836 RepID=A0A0L0DH79_THETB|nr:hypothetical protein AMSG_07688 [Thecamonas trahens ATCC 50062]KNC51491.1 hypothetical protein AMSG_07688 [Thecamonas trahens ATCC 50062]|eukprot:XP_013756149.1 hypothetical protein AMSG_07688 [Thecamonas trahens ATCC 50062]